MQSLGITTVLIAVSLLLHLPAFAEPADFVVAPGGDDQAPGTAAHPFLTLERARDAIRQLRASNRYPSAGVVIHLGPGDYRRSAPFEFTAEDSGKTGAPVIYRGVSGRRAHHWRLVFAFRIFFVNDPAIRVDYRKRARMRFDNLISLRGIDTYGPPLFMAPGWV